MHPISTCATHIPFHHQVLTNLSLFLFLHASVKDMFALFQSIFPLFSDKKSNQVCEEEAVQVEVFCLAINCVDRSPEDFCRILIFLFHSFTYVSSSPHIFFPPQVLGLGSLETEPAAAFGQCLSHGRLEGNLLLCLCLCLIIQHRIALQIF